MNRKNFQKKTRTFKTSVIIPTFNVPREIFERSLTSISKQKYPINEIEYIVVDDGSYKEFEVERVVRKKMVFKYVKVNKPEGVGFRSTSFAINEGIRRATGDIIIISGGTVLHTENTLLELITPHLKEEQLFLCSKVYNYSLNFKHKIDSGKLKVDELMKNSDKVITEDFKGQTSPLDGWWFVHPKHSPVVYPFCVSFKKKHFEKINGFREDMVVNGFEDLDFIQRFSFMFPDMKFKLLDHSVFYQQHDGVYGIKDAKEAPMDNFKFISENINLFSLLGKDQAIASKGLK